MTTRDTGYEDFTDPSKDSGQALRQRAEAIVREKAVQVPENLATLSSEETQHLLHELRVHQIELEMQNEELRRTQGELETSWARYFDLYDLAPVGYFTVSEQGLILEANLTVAALLEVARTALAKQPLSRFILPDDQDIYYRLRQQLLATGAPQVCELRLVKKDGAQFWARLEATGPHDADGAPVCRIAVSDISERMRAEESLRKAHVELERRVEARTADLVRANEQLTQQIEERTRAEEGLRSACAKLEAFVSISSLADTDVKTICDHVLASIVRMTDSELGFYGFINQDESVMTIHAWSGEVMKGCSVVDKPQRFSISEAGVWAEAIRHRAPLVLNDYGAAHAAKRGQPDGHVTLTNLLVVPFFSRGKITSVAAVANRAADYDQEDVDQIMAFLSGIQAITISKQAEEALCESEMKYRIVADNTYDWEWWMDPEGNFVYVSPSCKRVTQHGGEEFAKDPHLLLKIIHPGDQSAFIRHRAEAEQHASAGEIEFRILRPDGSLRWIGHVCQPVFDEKGRFLGRRGSNRDITERKQAEEELRESEKQLRHLSAQLMTAQEIERRRISRELHDELGAALAVLKLRSSFIEKNLRKDQVELRDNCRQNLDYIDQMIDNVDRLSRDLSPSILEDIGFTPALRWLIDNFVKNYHVKAASDIVDVDHLFPSDAKIIVYRIFQEALTNIGKHAQAKNVSVKVKEDEDMISFFVEDDGSGFDVDQATAKEAPEKRLGLAIMDERAGMLGGSLDLWSEEGKGTRVTLTVPIRKGEGL